MTGLVALGAGVAAAGGLMALDRLANTVVRPVPRDPDVDMASLGVRHEDLTIPSGDHVLRGWLLHPASDEGRPLVLLAHGWGASYGTLLQLAVPLASAGYPVLLFDVRGHGRNAPVPYVTVRHFRDDVLAVSRFAAERFPHQRRVLVGHSLGGAASVLAADMGAPVDGVVTVAAPADVLEVTAEYMRSKGLPGGLLVVVLRPFWWVRVGGTFRALVPEKKVGRLAVPLLLLHPENDHRVPREHALRLARSAGKELHVVSGAGHTDILGHPDTHAQLVAFLSALS